MEFNDRSIVLRLGSFRESDLWVHLLSPARGVFSAFAFGGSKSRKRFSGCLDLFNEVHFQIKGAQGSYLALQEGVLLKGPDKLRHDWRRLGMAVNCALFVEAVCKGPDGADRTHALFVDLLNCLEGDAPVSPFLPIFFRARLAFEQGYALNPHSCSLCGASLTGPDCEGGDSRYALPAALPVNEQGLLCRFCANKIQGSVRRFPLGRESLEVLRVILETPVGAWSAMNQDESSQKECIRATEAFVQYNLGLKNSLSASKNLSGY
jgi:DNA repair protein RecO (recombination protein O)